MNSLIKKIRNTIGFAYRTNPPFFILLCGVIGAFLFGTANVTYKVVTNDNGIVVLDGYSEAVGFCGINQMDWALFDDTGHWMKFGKDTVFVNPGHDADAQVAELAALTNKVCNKYH